MSWASRVRRAKPEISSVIFSAYGRLAASSSWDRRILTADTISMAFVIWLVFLTLRMRRRISRVLGIAVLFYVDCIHGNLPVDCLTGVAFGRAPIRLR